MIIGQEVSYVRELLEHIKDNNITSFKKLVDYVYSLETGNGYNDEYLELILEYTDFFVRYFKKESCNDIYKRRLLSAIEKSRK